MKVHTKIQKWGNGLALRIAGVMRDIPHFQEGSEVDIEVTEEGFTLRKAASVKKLQLPYSEADLLEGMTPFVAHADELATTLNSEIGD